jgi:RimJ/RimL family protein N-acetyltransferase
MNTKNLMLVPHKPNDLLSLLRGPTEYEQTSGMRVADGVRDFLLAASPDFVVQLEAATTPDPWKFGFAIVHKIDNVLIGMCGFTGPPDSDGAVEIAYSIAPAYQGKGYATEAAHALVAYANNDGRVRTIRAHTLPQVNASTRVLEKCGFKKTGEVVDSENNLVWRWEKEIDVSKSSVSSRTK